MLDDFILYISVHQVTVVIVIIHPSICRTAIRFQK